MMRSVEEAWMDEQCEEFWADADEAWRDEILREEWLDRRADALYEYSFDEDWLGSWFDYTSEEDV